jgi:antitoxin ParD1/3/4
MAIAETTVALPPDLMDAVAKAVETGEYTSSSDVVREALQEWVHNRSLTPQTIADLGQLWRRSVENEQPGVSADQVLNRLERKYQAMADKTTPSH